MAVFGDSILYLNLEEGMSCTACYRPDVCPVGAINSEEHVPEAPLRAPSTRPKTRTKATTTHSSCSPPTRPAKARTRTTEELEALLDGIRRRYRVLVPLAMVLGLRFSECAGLRVTARTPSCFASTTTSPCVSGPLVANIGRKCGGHATRASVGSWSAERRAGARAARASPGRLRPSFASASWHATLPTRSWDLTVAAMGSKRPGLPGVTMRRFAARAMAARIRRRQRGKPRRTATSHKRV
jgi:hypothetical protein